MALSPELKDAVTHIQSHAEGMRAVLTLADAIGNVQALEQLAAEAESRKGAATGELDGILAKITESKADLSKARDDIAAAKKQASEIVAKARDEASGIRVDAEAAGRKSADGILATAQKDKADTLASINVLKADLADVNAAITAAEADLANLKAEARETIKRADEARAYLANLAKTQ